jgi:SUN domain-containing protein 1/2
MVLWGLIENIGAVWRDGSSRLPQFCTTRCFVPSAARPARTEHFVRLGDFYYDHKSSHRLHAFSIAPYNNSGAFDTVVLQILNNWGGNSTCLYHFGVYGEAVDHEVK